MQQFRVRWRMESRRNVCGGKKKSQLRGREAAPASAPHNNNNNEVALDSHECTGKRWKERNLRSKKGIVISARPTFRHQLAHLYHYQALLDARTLVFMITCSWGWRALLFRLSRGGWHGGILAALDSVLCLLQKCCYSVFGTLHAVLP